MKSNREGVHTEGVPYRGGALERRPCTREPCSVGDLAGRDPTYYGTYSRDPKKGEGAATEGKPRKDLAP